MLCYIVICYFKILILYTLKPASFRCGLFFRFFVNCWGYSYQMRTNFIHLLFQSMMKGFFGSLWWGCGCPVDTSAKQKHRPSRQARHCQQSWLRERKYQIFRLLHSLPPSFASQNPPPSSEGGTVSDFKFTPYTHEHGVREQRKKFFRRYPNTIWLFTVKERMFSYENQN